jgi:sulfonate transport system permease protein
MRARALADRLNLAGWGLIIALIALWQLLTASGVLSLDYLPRPTAVVSALGQIIKDGTLATELGHTLGTAAIASVIAVGAGVALGALIGLVRPAAVLSGATVDFLRSVPAVSLMPVVLLLLGATMKSEIIVGVFAGLWPILLSTIGGVQAIDHRLHEVGSVLHLSRWDRTRKILIPSAVPMILVGVRLTVVTCLVVVIIAEILINPAGIGWSLSQAQKALRPDLLFAYAVVTGLLGYLINLALIVGVRRCMPGSPALRGRV